MTGSSIKERQAGKELFAKKGILNDKGRLRALEKLLDDAVWKRIIRNGMEFYPYYNEKIPDNVGKGEGYSIYGNFLKGDESRLDGFVFDASDWKALNEGGEMAFYIDKAHADGRTEVSIKKMRRPGLLPSSGKPVCGLPEEHAAELLDRMKEEPGVYDALEFVSEMRGKGIMVPIPDKLLPRQIDFIARKEGDTVSIYYNGSGLFASLERGCDIRSDVGRISDLASIGELEQDLRLGSLLSISLWQGDETFNAIVRTARVLHMIYVDPPEKWDGEKIRRAVPEVKMLAAELYEGNSKLFNGIANLLLEKDGSAGVDMRLVSGDLKAPHWKKWEPGVRSRRIETSVIKRLERHGIDTGKVDGKDIDLVSRIAVALAYLKETLLKLDGSA